MPDQTITYGLPYPLGTDVPDVPADIRKLAEAIEGALEFVLQRIAMPIGTILALAPGQPVLPGWALCNGQNGTPNLAGRTLVGAGISPDTTHFAGQGATYTAGQFGGFASVKLTAATSGIGRHEHVGTTTVNIPAHSHTVPAQTVNTSTNGGSHQHGGTTGASDRSLNHSHHGATVGMNGNQVHSHGGYGNNWQGSTQAQNPAGADYGPIGNDPSRLHAAAEARNIDHVHGIHAENLDHLHHFATDWRDTNHNHTVTTPAVETGTGAPVAGGEVSMSASQPEDAQQPHENRSPYYVVQYIMRIA